MRTRLFDLVGCLSSAMDLVSPEVVHHHHRVGIIAARLADAAGLPAEIRAELALAGMLHDVGAFSLKIRLAALSFDSDDISHPEIGFRLLRGYAGFERVAGMVRSHHAAWSSSGRAGQAPSPEEELGNLLCLADRTDALLPRTQGAAVDLQAILSRLRDGEGRVFNPPWVRALEEIVLDQPFWDAVLGRPAGPTSLGGAFDLDGLISEAHNPVLSAAEIFRMSRLISQIIDFRSRFTATHSRGVASTAVALGHELGMSQEDLTRMDIAGELHDLGKLGIPSELIVKPAALDTGEMRVMRRHAEYGQKVLSGVPGMEDVAVWVGQHHERLDGQGYPFGVDSGAIGLGSRVLAVSDVFTAVCEDRPYRQGMSLAEAVTILSDMARAKTLDAAVVETLVHRRADLDALRRDTQSQALRDFERFAKGDGETP